MILCWKRMRGAAIMLVLLPCWAGLAAGQRYDHNNLTAVSDGGLQVLQYSDLDPTYGIDEPRGGAESGGAFLFDVTKHSCVTVMTADAPSITIYASVWCSDSEQELTFSSCDGRNGALPEELCKGNGRGWREIRRVNDCPAWTTEETVKLCATSVKAGASVGIEYVEAFPGDFVKTTAAATTTTTTPTPTTTSTTPPTTTSTTPPTTTSTTPPTTTSTTPPTTTSTTPPTTTSTTPPTTTSTTPPTTTSTTPPTTTTTSTTPPTTTSTTPPTTTSTTPPTTTTTTPPTTTSTTPPTTTSTTPPTTTSTTPPTTTSTTPPTTTTTTPPTTTSTTPPTTTTTPTPTTTSTTTTLAPHHDYRHHQRHDLLTPHDYK
ncbi:mucin-2-like [Eriocheir sinensis]|uniref:mucin-2-like n=1 Tax=Eriocheir sinensis TaxID=95602 RepID=UPI0021C6EB79|nr:mucin-2-like [Eriocheir sinensis]